ncbi:hypothetical protein [Asticcacaulis sp. AC402]|uniref:hypothetical protein n=1 Tax=Asticcacaulis sp. AC402 TaxID=1282361 RepID=UPI0012DE2B8B|nr:hypothetical protein [Asticcacaulis sp. AC402]
MELTADYRQRAGSPVALKFVGQLDDAVNFIAKRPTACPVYIWLEGKEFRKWVLKDFPVSVFFRLADDAAITLEALYAQRMNIAARLPKDMESSSVALDYGTRRIFRL